MRRSPYLAISLLAVCALSVAGCQRGGPADPQATEASASNPDVIDAVPLAPDAAPQPQTAPQPKPKTEDAPVAAPVMAEEPQATIPEGPDMAPEPVPVSAQSCRDAIGSAAAARLVERCIRVSPATRPPCNAANPCDLIQGEIDRSCKLWQGDGNPPAECRN